jgi:hypothetical protein
MIRELELSSILRKTVPSDVEYFVIVHEKDMWESCNMISKCVSVTWDLDLTMVDMKILGSDVL